MSLSSRLTPSRRWRLPILALVPLLAGSAIVAQSAHADTGYGYCQAAACNGLDPIKENCQVNAFTVSAYSETVAGYGTFTVDLRYSPDCQANWARVYTPDSEKFCVTDGHGNIQSYTSAAGEASSWTNMVNGAVSGDTAYLDYPNHALYDMYADDTPGQGTNADAPYGCFHG